MAIIWLVPFTICLIAGTAFEPLDTRPYLIDPGVWTKSFVAIGLFILAEARIEKGLHGGVTHFHQSGLLPLSSLAPANAAVAQALQRRDNAAKVRCWPAGASLFLLRNMRDQTAASWAVIPGAVGSQAAIASVDLSTHPWFLNPPPPRFHEYARPAGCKRRNIYRYSRHIAPFPGQQYQQQHARHCRTICWD